MNRNITVRAVIGTTDSYEIRYLFPRIDVNELIDIIQKEREISEYRYNLYSGGEVDSTMPVIKCYRPGFIRHDCIKLQLGSEENCREFEELIKPLFDEDNFSARVYPKDVVE